MRTCELMKQALGLGSEVLPIRENIQEALVKNRLGPSGAYNAGADQADEKIPERNRVENARNIEDDEGHQGPQYPRSCFSASDVSSSSTALR